MVFGLTVSIKVAIGAFSAHNNLDSSKGLQDDA